MAPSREIPHLRLLIAGCLIVLCCAAGLGALVLAGRLYTRDLPYRPPTLPPATPTLPITASPSATETVSSTAPLPQPQGKIVYVCQVFSVQERDQICIINADGTGQRRLTTEDDARHFYPSLSPDGQSVLYSSNQNGNFEIYEFALETDQLTRLGGIVGIAPEVSPDNRYVVFTRSDGQQTDTIWVMDRYGLNPREIYNNGWDPTWSPDSQKILFATMVGALSQLATINLDGSDFKVVTALPSLRGRSDWSPDGQYMITYSGPAWGRELYMLRADGSDLHQVGPAGGDSQGPSFSSDGQWIAFTAYFDHPHSINGCEIYIMRVDGSDLRRLTNNSYCDWQPRWGP